MANKLTGRPKLPKPAEETLRIAVLAAGEILTWPDVTEKPMFGLRCFYRGAAAFALLPNKRALEDAYSIGYKMGNGKEEPEGRKWRLCVVAGPEMGNSDGLNRALKVLGEAWESQGLS